MKFLNKRPLLFNAPLQIEKLGVLFSRRLLENLRYLTLNKRGRCIFETFYTNYNFSRTKKNSRNKETIFFFTFRGHTEKKTRRQPQFQESYFKKKEYDIIVEICLNGNLFLRDAHDINNREKLFSQTCLLYTSPSPRDS